MKRKRITILHEFPHSPASYVKQDIEMLKVNYDVVDICVQNIRDWPSFLPLAKHVANSHLVLGWFADYPALFANLIAKLFRRKSLTIIIGCEVANEPEIDYGRLRRLDGRFFVRWALKSADKVLAVSQFSQREAIEHLQLKPSRIELVYHGFPIPAIEGELIKEPFALTVAFINRFCLKNKGVETFVRSAAYLPQVPFVVLGDWHDRSVIKYLQTIASPNVQFLEVGPQASQVLESYYKRAKVYVQASVHESFGCSLAEAMLWQCVPVVTRCGALPEVVGDTGFYVAPNQPEELTSQIALALDSDKGLEARQRIIEQFPLEARRKALLDIVGELLES